MTIRQQRTFLVTGASKGIGLALSRRLAKSGHKVVGIARHTDNVAFPGTLVPIDLSDNSQVEEGLRTLLGQHRFDGVVNNVALVHPAPLNEVQLDQLDKVFAVNLHPAVRIVQGILPQLIEQGWGRIVNISSLTVLGVVHRTSYAAAKAALISFARSWALELAQTGITVNAVAPGPTETELFRTNNPRGSDGEKRYLSGVPMNRFGQPDEIAAAIEFLLSEDAGFITGQTLFVDGGASIGKQLI